MHVAAYNGRAKPGPEAAERHRQRPAGNSNLVLVRFPSDPLVIVIVETLLQFECPSRPCAGREHVLAGLRQCRDAVESMKAHAHGHMGGATESLGPASEVPTALHALPTWAPSADRGAYWSVSSEVTPH